MNLYNIGDRVRITNSTYKGDYDGVELIVTAINSELPAVCGGWLLDYTLTVDRSQPHNPMNRGDCSDGWEHGDFVKTKPAQ
ncbi:MAG: hypothetical protein WBF53_11510 [Litorimonas sp.]